MNYTNKIQELEEMRSWREQLGTIISNNQERQRVASQLGVNPLTLTRWANNKSSPQKQSLQKLVSILPQHRTELLELVSDEWKDGSSMEADPEIPSIVYNRILHAYATTHPTLLFWSITQLVLRQALLQLDPGQESMTAIVAQCMPPSYEGKVRSIRECTGLSNVIGNSNLEQRSIFLGVESLVGSALSSFYKKIVQDFAEERHVYPRILQDVEERSAVACPILHANGAAGCLLVSSTIPNFFSPYQCSLIEQYTELLGLAFTHEQFYPFECIELRPMPPEQVQKARIGTFRQRVNETVKERTARGESLTLSQAEQIVWRKLEEELLQEAIWNP